MLIHQKQKCQLHKALTIQNLKVKQIHNMTEADMPTTQNHRRKHLKLWLALLGGHWLGCRAAQAAPESTPLRPSRPWLETTSPAAATPALPMAVARGSTPAGPTQFWLSSTLQLVQKYRINPLRAARVFSYMATAMADAANLARDQYGETTEHQYTLAALAAAPLLNHFFSEESPGHWQAMSLLYSAHFRPRSEQTWQMLQAQAHTICTAAISRAMNDNSARINAVARPPSSMHHAWIASPPLWGSRPVEPGAPGWLHWTTAPQLGNDCPPPLRPDSAEYREAVLEVLQTHKHLSEKQKKIAESWNLDVGTATPPGVWLLKTLSMPELQKQTPTAQLDMLAMLTTAMLDAFIACWHVKFKWWSERPVTAIRRMFDSDFLPHVITPAFPSYVSGHATVSGAASTMLAHFFPHRADECRVEAEEAALSRLYGGIHFSFDNNEGLKLGQRVAEAAWEQRTSSKRAN